MPPVIRLIERAADNPNSIASVETIRSIHNISSTLISLPYERSFSMFTRVVEINCKAGKTNEVATLANDKVLPILRKQQGFQDEITLVSHKDPNRMLALSFWTKREDAERYQREQFSHIAEMLRPLCSGEPVISTYDVNTSTVHHIHAGKAA
jgi:quinol monooxygenase YgiN